MDEWIDYERLAKEANFGEYARDLVNNPYWETLWRMVEQAMLREMAETAPHDDAGRRHWHAQVAALNNLEDVLRGIVEKGSVSAERLEKLKPRNVA